MEGLSKRKRAIASLIVVVMFFSGFWGISVVAAAIGGVPIEKAFPDKFFFLTVVCTLQVCLLVSYPLQRPFHLGLRVFAVVIGFIFSSEYFMSELVSFNLLPRESVPWWGRLTVLFALGLGFCLFLISRKCLPRQEKPEMESSANVMSLK